MNPKLCFVFCHGFGFDSTFWNPLRPYFSRVNTVYLDLGYFGDPYWVMAQPTLPASSTEYIGIGHSLGMMKLMSLNIPFKCLIGLHGFVNFLGFNAQLHRRRQRELMHLTEQFNESPELTLSQFYQRTGVDFNLPIMGRLNQVRLLDDLSSLAHSIAVPVDVPMLVLGSNDDKIVPPVLIEDNFSPYPHVTIDILNQAQHGLGYLKPDMVYQNIMRFLEF
jgi:pimeloyl-[acyl-carrier protein] methyl ester esterase